MGREIKRVAANFDWPLEKIWDGFLMGDDLLAIPCKTCDQSGVNAATKRISDNFYGDGRDDPERWCDKITQDEVAELVKAGRLIDLTHTWSRERKWQPKDPPYMPTADEVNRAQSGSFLSSVHHDAISRWILIKARAKRLGVYGDCSRCGGHGEGWRSDAHHAAHDAWTETEVPSGDWWQVWETVSEGSPVTPAFATAEELIGYLVAKGDAWDQKRGSGGWERKNAESFVKAGFSFSLTIGPDGIKEPRDGQF
jgi:hypothetical protein